MFFRFEIMYCYSKFNKKDYGRISFNIIIESKPAKNNTNFRKTDIFCSKGKIVGLKAIECYIFLVGLFKIHWNTTSFLCCDTSVVSIKDTYIFRTSNVVWAYGNLLSQLIHKFNWHSRIFFNNNILKLNHLTY